MQVLKLSSNRHTRTVGRLCQKPGYPSVRTFPFLTAQRTRELGLVVSTRTRCIFFRRSEIFAELWTSRRKSRINTTLLPRPIACVSHSLADSLAALRQRFGVVHGSGSKGFIARKFLRLASNVLVLPRVPPTSPSSLEGWESNYCWPLPVLRTTKVKLRAAGFVCPRHS